MTPLPTGESKSVDRRQRKLALLGVHDDGHGQGCSLARSTLASFCSTSSAEKPGAGSMWTTFGRPSVSVPVLSTHQRVDLLHPLQRLGIPDEHAVLGALADAHHDGHRRGQAQRTRTGDDEHGHRGDERVAERGRRPPDQPGHERQHGDQDDDGHEPAGHLVGHPLDGRATALRCCHHVDDLGEQRICTDLLGTHHEAAGLVHGPGGDLRPDGLGNRNRLTRHHRLVDVALAFGELAVDRHLLARAHAQQLSDLDGVDLHGLVAPIRHSPSPRSSVRARAAP